jgi:hypothetical protein
MKKSTKFSITLVGTTLLGNSPVADITSPADNPTAHTPQNVANDSFLSKLGIPADLRIARGATWRDNREGDTKPLSAASNDNLANAIPITALPYTSTSEASQTSQSLETNEILPSCNASGTAGYGTIWYQYTPTHDHTVVITTYSKNLSVWTGTTQSLTELACGSSGVAWNGSSRLALDLTAGTTYYINLGIVATLKETWLEVKELMQAPNDNLANATLITSLPYQTQQQAQWATTETLEKNASCEWGIPQNSVWYQYTPTTDQTVAWESTGSDSWTRPGLSLWYGTNQPLTELSCELVYYTSFLLSKLTAGTTYYLKVAPTNFFGLFNFSLFVSVPPTNDNLTNATVIPALPYSNTSQEVFGSTHEDLEVSSRCGEGNADGSVWYQYTPPKNQAVEFSVPSGSYLSVWHGTTHPLTELTCVSSYWNPVTVLLKLTVDTTYYIKVSGPSNQKTSVFFKATEVTLPNDNLTNATVIPTLPYSNTALETFESTREDLELLGSCGGETDAYGSVWYQYTPTKNQAVKFWARSEPFPIILSVWSGTTHPLTELTCFSPSYNPSATPGPPDYGFTGESKLNLTAGTSYYIKVSSLSNQKPSVSFTATEITPPSNDDLAKATVIPALPYGHSQNTQGATTEPNEVNEFNYEPNAGGCGEGYFIYGFGYSVRYQYTSSVWYQYTPDHDQLVEFDTLGSNYDTVLSVWTGTTHPLTPLTCNNNEYGGVLSQTNLKLTVDTTYYIKVGSRMSLYDGDNGGILNLYAQEVLPPSNDNLDQTIPITALPYTHQQNTQGASLEAKEVMASCAKSNMGTSVWYTYTPATSQTVILDTQTSSYDTVLSVWTGNSPPLTEIACHNDLSASNLQSKLSVALTAGTTYSINVSSDHSPYSPVSAGTLNLTVTANDLQLSPLGPANMIDALGNPVTSSTEVWGGISVNGSAYQAQVIENLSDEVEVWGKMKVDPNYVGQTAETVVYAIYKSSALVPEEYFYMVDNRYSIYPWDQNPANLMALQTVRLAAEQWQAIYRGRFPVPGVIDLFWGYRLADGTVVTNSQGLRVTINRQVNQY